MSELTKEHFDACMRRIDKRFEGIEDRLDRIEIEVAGCKNKVDVLTTRFNTLTFVVRTEGHEEAERHAREHPIDS